ncbi:TolC family protein [Yoonia sp. GPGPB17]|uniref:TolC family protein n=1 Tax=Yoonia sp. GPGPB17 TaxID=3026147 RepID=UPI0030C11D1E
MPISRRSVTFVMVSGLLAACTPTADLVPTPTAELTVARAFSSGLPSSALPMVSSNWWHSLGSAELSGLIGQVLADNPDLAAASFRVLQSELELGNTRSQMRPTATTGLTRTTTDASTPAGERDTSTTTDLSATVRWEADLWGRIESEGDSAAARFLATGYDRDALANSLIASVVRTYVSISFDRRQIGATRRIVDSRATSLSVTQERFGLGVEDTSA